MHLRFNFDACPMHSPSGFVHLTHQNLSARALFCLNSLAKVNTQLLIYNYTCRKGTIFQMCIKIFKKNTTCNENPHSSCISFLMENEEVMSSTGFPSLQGSCMSATEFMSDKRKEIIVGSPCILKGGGLKS